MTQTFYWTTENGEIGRREIGGSHNAVGVKRQNEICHLKRQCTILKLTRSIACETLLISQCQSHLRKFQKEFIHFLYLLCPWRETTLPKFLCFLKLCRIYCATRMCAISLPARLEFEILYYHRSSFLQ